MNNVKSNKNTKTEYERLWLKYFNDTLLAKGIISEEDFRKMNTKIIAYNGKA